jgi:hypothetical protein
MTEHRCFGIKVESDVTSSRNHRWHHSLNINFILHSPTTTMTIPPFETTFAVPMTCEACIKDIKGSLDQVAGMLFQKM